MLVLGRKVHEALLIESHGKRIRIVIAGILARNRVVPDGVVRIAIDAPPEVAIWREELGDALRYRPKSLRNAQQAVSEGERKSNNGRSVE